jgi:hypothetical protein
MIPTTMDQKQWRRIEVAPIDVVQPKALRNKAVCDGAM